MLSDVLFEYGYVDDKILGAAELAQYVEHYSSPPWDYPDEMIGALRVACASVLKDGDVASVEHLNGLAESVREFLDGGWSFADWRAPPAKIEYSEHPFIKDYVKSC